MSLHIIAVKRCAVDAEKAVMHAPMLPAVDIRDLSLIVALEK